MRTKRIKLVTFMLIIAAAIAAAIAWFGQEKPIEVIVKKASTGVVQETVANTRAGTIEACRRAGISPSIGGQIASLPVKEGDLVEKDQVLRVDSGHVAMFEPSVEFDIEIVKGFKNIFFGGEGLFFAILKGPGKVWLQSMPLANLAGKIGQYLATGKHAGSSKRGIGGMIESFRQGI